MYTYQLWKNLNNFNLLSKVTPIVACNQLYSVIALIWSQLNAIDLFTNFMHTILTKVVPDNLKACPRFV